MVIHSINEISNGKLNESSLFDEIYDFFNGIELSSDFIFTNYSELQKYDELLGDISNRFFVFATTGQGDLWLIEKNNLRIYYYDHDIENIDISNFINLELDIYEWLKASDLFRQVDLLVEQDNLTEEDQMVFRELIKKNMPKLLDVFYL